jgi:glycerol kinase
MSHDLLLAIDQGTRSTRAVVFDDQGRQLAIARRPVTVEVRNGHEVEQSADEILASVEAVLHDVMTDAAADLPRIRAAGLATQRSSVVAWDRVGGQALSPVIGWQDRRATDIIAAMSGHAREVADRTGLRLSPHYGAAKLQWLLHANRAVRQALASNRLLLGPLSSYLGFHLLQHRPAIVDHANAARTLLWNLRTGDWDAHLLRLFGVLDMVLPACRPIIGAHGRVDGHGIPVTAINGDQTAALYAQGEPPRDTLVVNIGTGAFVLLPVRDPFTRPAGLLAGISLSHADTRRYYVEGTVNGAAAALDWAQRRFGIDAVNERLPDWLAAAREPPVFVNTVGGLGSPWWRPAAAPYFLEDPQGPADGMVAVIESIVFLLQANIEWLQAQHPGIRGIRVSGGLAHLDGLCQRLADLSRLAVQRLPAVEATARGIAWQAAGCPPDWQPGDHGTAFAPLSNPGLQARYRRLIEALGGPIPRS